MKRKGIHSNTIILLQKLMHESLTIGQPALHPRQIGTAHKVQSVLIEFCKELGSLRVTVLVVIALCLSLCVAYMITGLSENGESRMPIIIDNMKKTEL